LRAHSPDVLLTAGYSLQDGGDLQDLGRKLEDMAWPGLVFVEVMDWCGDPARSAEIDGQYFDLSAHCLFAWLPSEGWRNLGRQFFTDGKQANREPTRIRAFEAGMKGRTIEFQGKKIGALICGEINALRGRTTVSARTAAIDTWISDLDIIVNPTHDRMGNHGTLRKKREFLSRRGDGRQRIYVHASNWNSHKEQKLHSNIAPDRTKKTRFVVQRRSQTLHSVFCNSDPVLPMDSTLYCDFQYREVSL